MTEGHRARERWVNGPGPDLDDLAKEARDQRICREL